MSGSFLYDGFEEKKMNDFSGDYDKAMAVLNDLAKEYESWVKNDMELAQSLFDQAVGLKSTQRTQLMHNEFFRVIHDMKGQGATFDYDLITEVGNHLCRYVEKQKSFNDESLTEVKRHLDWMAKIIKERLTGDGGKKGFQILKEMESLDNGR